MSNDYKQRPNWHNKSDPSVSAVGMRFLDRQGLLDPMPPGVTVSHQYEEENKYCEFYSMPADKSTDLLILLAKLGYDDSYSDSVMKLFGCGFTQWKKEKREQKCFLDLTVNSNRTGSKITIDAIYDYLFEAREKYQNPNYPQLPINYEEFCTLIKLLARYIHEAIKHLDVKPKTDTEPIVLAYQVYQDLYERSKHNGYFINDDTIVIETKSDSPGITLGQLNRDFETNQLLNKKERDKS